MITKITTGAYFGTNSYVISNDNNECIVVDPGLDYLQAAEEIKQKYVVKAILITHGHCDHIDGIRYFDCPVYISSIDEKCLYDEKYNLYPMIKMKCPYKPGMINTVVVEDGMELNLIGYKIRVVATPGHTSGSVCFAYNDKLLSGDTLFHESVGRTDFPGGSSLKLQQSVNRLISLFPDNTDVYPGHNSKTTIKHERQNNPFLV